MSTTSVHDRFLAHPVVDGYLRFCLYLLGGGIIAFATFIGFVLIRVSFGFSPLPKVWMIVIVISVVAGGIGALLVFLLHRLARSRMGSNQRLQLTDDARDGE